LQEKDPPCKRWYNNHKLILEAIQEGEEHSRELEVSLILSPSSFIGASKEVKGTILGWQHLNYIVFEKEGSTLAALWSPTVVGQLYCSVSYSKDSNRI
jgi:hypothetical protein